MIRLAGEHGLLVETGALEVSHRLDALLRGARPAGVEEIVPGPETVLVVAPGMDAGRLRAVLEAMLADARAGVGATSGRTGAGPGGKEGAREEAGTPGAAGTGMPGATGVGGPRRGPGEEAVVIPVRYDGADLEPVAELAGISVEEVIARHVGSDLVVGWLGFAPGFAYLTGLDPVLHVPRLDTPRTSVPAGSVAIAGPYSAVYPSASPGGWRLLGRTDVRVWDVRADPPSLFRPGMRVRFEAA
ncbi:5-oxoprolinase subunit B family protein [Thermoactinospora rubra]|uniref:5-oxoprolinase subunit B family protein n=1 Tax=Thermoactinospora rubra TaxID=1088767 RepID=UPI000A11D081|nr:allophanate hydrolase subunit 1 [Thermoactinospora rubra]